MSINATRVVRGAVLLALVAGVAACGLPRSGPTKRQLLSSSVEQRGDAYVVTVDDRVAAETDIPPGLGFAAAFENAGVVASDTISPGDALTITIWENVEQGVLSRGTGATALTNVQVDGQGFIFVPYAGRIRAAGNSPEALRQTITRQLEDQTPDPQVLVSRTPGDGATVSIIGKVGGQGIFPLERPTRTLTAMLAAAGGVTVEPEIAQVTVIRGGQRGTIWLQDLYADPRNDIALRASDRILVEEDSRSYVALGATGGQTRIDFDSQELSAMEALAQVGGLASAAADPTGIFVLREEPAAVANRVLGRGDLVRHQRMIYLIDLTEPNGLFVARDFRIRDGDTIYVTEAPFVQWQKVIGAITGSANQAAAVANVANSGN